MRVALNTNLVGLRKEKSRILIFKKDKYDHLIEKYGFIHPSVAIFLAILNYKKNLEETVNELLYISGLPNIEYAKRYVDNAMKELKENFGDDIFIDLDEHTEEHLLNFDPMKFIMENEKVNLGGQRLDAPLNINFIVTQDCNRNCIYCYAEKEKAPHFELLPLSRIYELIDEAKSIGVLDITFSGGEPFLRRDIVKIIKHTIEAGLYPFVSTKNYLSFKVCKELKISGLETIQISIDSGDKEIANFLVGSKHYHSQIIKTIKNVKAAGLMIKTKAVATPFNIFSIPRLLSMLHDLGVARMQITQYGKSAFRHRANLFLEEDEIKWLKNEIENFKIKNPDMIVYDNLAVYKPVTTYEEKLNIYNNRSVCSIGKVAITILPDGRVLACEQLPTNELYIVGNLNSQSIMDVWNSELLWNIVCPPRELFKGELCFNCDQFNECHINKGRCIRDAVNAYGKPFTPDPRCPFNNIEIRLQ